MYVHTQIITAQNNGLSQIILKAKNSPDFILLEHINLLMG